jgi:FkbM family methyltransferase
MSLADFVDHSRDRFREQPASTALQGTLEEFRNRLSIRQWNTIFDVIGGRTVNTTLAGVEATWFVDSGKALNRARTLCREEPVAKWLFQDLESESAMWDIGSYHGHYAVLAGLKGATVTAFEPNPDNRARLAMHVRDLNNVSTVEIFSAGLSDKEARQSLSDAGSMSELGDGKLGVWTIPGDDIDEQPTHVKIDVEGHETAVLEGMAETLQNVQRIAVEVHDEDEYWIVHDRLVDAGFSVTDLDTPRQQMHLGGER